MLDSTCTTSIDGNSKGSGCLPTISRTARGQSCTPLILPCLSPSRIFICSGRHARGLYARSAATCCRGEDGSALRGVGAERARGVGDRGLERLESRRARAKPRWDGSGIWEATIPACIPARHTSTAIVSQYPADARKRRSVRVSTGKKRRAPPRARGVSTTRGATASGCARARRATRSTRRCRTYELHLGSWRRDATTGSFLGYRAIAGPLVEHVKRLGFTHVEIMPITEHPFYGSWGYQTTGYFAPTSRYGTPQDFMYLVDTLHQNGIGVILDWVPSHFPNDEHGLYRFDGTHLYEHADPRQGYHPEWNSAIFNYGRNEVRAFLMSSALFWLEHYHIDGLRVDAVASMLYLDYGAQGGEWIPNKYGGTRKPRRDPFPAHAQRSGLPRSSRRADDRRGIDRVADGLAPGVPRRPRLRAEVEHGLDARHARLHAREPDAPQDTITTRSRSRSVYAFNENFVLPLSHDEVVHGKGSLIGKMPGDALAEVREPAAALRLHVVASRQEAPLHGRRVRPAPRMAARGEPRMVGAPATPSTAGSCTGSRT